MVTMQGWPYLTELHEAGIGLLAEDSSRQLRWCYIKRRE